MNERSNNGGTDFWVYIMERLGASKGDEELDVILDEICGFFGFLYSGIYYNYNERAGKFTGSTKRRGLPLHLDFLQVFTEAEYQEIFESQYLYHSKGRENTGLEDKLTSLFDEENVFVFPIFGEKSNEYAMIVLTGLKKSDMPFSLDEGTFFSVLVMLANYIRLGMGVKRLSRTEKALTAIVDHMGVDIYVNDFLSHDILYVNQSMAAPYGGAEKMLGRRCYECLYEGQTSECTYCPQKKIIDKDGKPTRIYSWDYKRPFDGSWFRVLSGAFKWKDGRIAHIVSSIDITEHKRYEEEARKIAEVDILTKLPNRRKLEETLRRKNEEKKKEACYILFFDLDNFKHVNDTYGHRTGDELLKAVGDHLLAGESTKNVSYRIGGDEFVLLMFEYTREQVLRVISSLLKFFLEPIRTTEASILTGCSIGIAKYPEDADDYEEVLRLSDQAMYESKMKEKGSVTFYSSNQSEAGS